LENIEVCVKDHGLETLLRPLGLWLGGLHFYHFYPAALPVPYRELQSLESNTGKSKERGNSDPKNMSPQDRIEEFLGENFCLRGGKLL